MGINRQDLGQNMRRQGDIQEKRVGYGRIPNTLIKSGAWALFDRRMMAVFVALVGSLDRTMKYTDGEGTWRVSYGHPTLEQIAKASRVRRADISRITDLFEEIGLIIKKPETINRKPRVRYILLPPEHPMSSRIGDSCVRIYQQTAKNWGLRRAYRPLKKSHESPDRRLSHESPMRRPSTDIHRQQISPTGDKSGRRMGGPLASGCALRSASPPDPHLPLRKFGWSQLGTAREEKGDVGLLAEYFCNFPRDEWEDHVPLLEQQGYRLRVILEAQEIAAGIGPYLSAEGENKNERRLCLGIGRGRSECVLLPLPGSRYCRHHQRQTVKA